MTYAELAVTTNFSFLRGASHPSEFVLRAIELGHAGIGIADRNSVAGVVRALSACRQIEKALKKEHGDDARLPLKLAVGARLVFADGTPDILAYPQNRAGWGNLCRLLSHGNREQDGEKRRAKGACILAFADLERFIDNMLLILMPDDDVEAARPHLTRLAVAAPGAVWLAASMLRRGKDRRRLAGLRRLAGEAHVPLIAVNDVLYHAPERRVLQDVVTCIREGRTIETAGRLLEANAERHLKEIAEMRRLFRDAPEAVAETTDFLARVDFSLAELRHDYPMEPIPPGKTAQQHLEDLTWKHAVWRYPGGVPAKVEHIIEEELALIARLGYAHYFLTIHDIVRFARDQRILCQGRGSAANSAVCYALGITAVDPNEHELLYSRFISEKRGEPPDIDVDFEHERREEVIQHLYTRYGRERAGIAATVIHYRPRSAIREVGKVMGLTEDVTARIGALQWGGWGDEIPEKNVRDAGLDPRNPQIERAVRLASQLLHFPRHLSQHVGGFVLTAGRLDEVVPIGNAAMEDRTFIEWDKDDLDEVGLMKVDVLALGMLTCIRKCLDLIEQHRGEKLDLAGISACKEDREHVYAMLQKGDSIGVFQVESRAQINMLPRLKPKEFYDLVIQVAIVRPGPIQGDMVHPYLRRRAGLEDVHYPSPSPQHGPPDELRKVLHRTLGVPLFQEQAMRLAMVAAKFTPDEANELRKAMATFRHVGTIHQFETLMVERMVERGYERDFAQRCFDQIKGFGEYGFPESHAASFAHLVYVSSWIKCFHPAVFACGLLNAQPMGFYAPAQIVRDAREHGVEVRGIDVNHSAWDNTLETAEDGSLALRLGFRQVDGFRQTWADAVVAARGGGFARVEDVWRFSRIEHRALRLAADADAFRSIGLDRRAALWEVRRLPADDPLPLFAAARARELGMEEDARLPAMALSEHVVADYQTHRLSLKAHPMEFLRPAFAREKVTACADIKTLRDASFARVAGVVLVRQRPGKGNAIFMTIEDETGIANALIWARKFEHFRREIMSARLVVLEGRIQRSPEGVDHVMVNRVIDRTDDLRRLSASHEARITLSPADEFENPQHPRGRHPRDVRILPKSRDFH